MILLIINSLKAKKWQHKLKVEQGTQGPIQIIVFVFVRIYYLQRSNQATMTQLRRPTLLLFTKRD